MVIDVHLYLKKQKRRDTPSSILADTIIYIGMEQIVTIISAKKNPEAKKVALTGMQLGWVRNNRVMLGYERGGNRVVLKHTLLVCQHALASFAFLA